MTEQHHERSTDAPEQDLKSKTRTAQLLTELTHHAPFTLLGAVLGIAFMLIFRNLSGAGSRTLFAIFHPGHIILSALVTASLFRLHRKDCGFLTVLVVGYFGSVGVATLSDSVIPYLGERLFGLDVPSHAALHEQPATETHSEPHDSHDHEHTPACAHEHGGHGIHLGFIEEWYIVNPAALLGIIIGFYLPMTRLPHFLHVLVSTWASSAHIMMNAAAAVTAPFIAGALITLFIAVWVPCCLSDIIFPGLFFKSNIPIHGCHCNTCKDERTEEETEK